MQCSHMVYFFIYNLQIKVYQLSFEENVIPEKNKT